MFRKRRRHPAAFKLRIALEALEGSKAVSQLSSEHEIHPNMIRAWKRQLLEDGPRVFYNHERPHQSLNYRTSAEKHFVLCSMPAAFAQMHPIFPFSWSNDWGKPYPVQYAGLLPPYCDRKASVAHLS